MAPLPVLPNLGILKPVLIAARIVPLLVIVCLSAPAWLIWVFLPAPRQQVVLDMVAAMAAWACAATDYDTKPDKAEPRPPDGRKAKGAGARSSTAVRPSRQRSPGGGGRQRA